MIVQQINLYQDRFKEKKILLSALQIVIITSLCVLLLVLSSYWYKDSYTTADKQNQELLLKKQQVNQQLEKQKRKLEALLDDNRVDRQLAQISHDISVRKRMIDFVVNNQFGSGQGFAKNLAALSELKVEDVWLNEITLAQNYVKLSGSALRAENIPEYFNQISNRDLFNGRVFEIFELDRTQGSDWKVDFVIASSAEVDE